MNEEYYFVGTLTTFGNHINYDVLNRDMEILGSNVRIGPDINAFGEVNPLGSGIYMKPEEVHNFPVSIDKQTELNRAIKKANRLEKKLAKGK